MNNAKFQYCILKSSSRLLSNKMDFELQLGVETLENNLIDESLKQATRKVTDCYDVVDALNYMSTLGWEIVHVNYREFSGTTYNNPQYLMKRQVG
jgi:alkyl hydroperoxide reductase subunit AhpF